MAIISHILLFCGTNEGFLPEESTVFTYP